MLSHDFWYKSSTQFQRSESDRLFRFSNVKILEAKSGKVDVVTSKVYCCTLKL